MLQEGSSLWEALASIRSTPATGSLPSPAVLLQGRNLRGSLPFSQSALQPRVVPPAVVKQQLQKQQSSAAFTQARQLDSRSSSLQVGQAVRVRISRRWIPGKVFRVCPQPNSYVIRTLDGRYFRRNRSAINVIRASVPQPAAAAAAVERAVHHQPMLHPSARPASGSSSASAAIPPLSVQPADSGQSPVIEGSPFHGFSSRPPPDPSPSGGTTRSGRSYLAPPRQLFSRP